MESIAARGWGVAWVGGSAPDPRACARARAVRRCAACRGWGGAGRGWPARRRVCVCVRPPWRRARRRARAPRRRARVVRARARARAARGARQPRGGVLGRRSRDGLGSGPGQARARARARAGGGAAARARGCAARAEHATLVDRRRCERTPRRAARRGLLPRRLLPGARSARVRGEARRCGRATRRGGCAAAHPTPLAAAPDCRARRVNPHAPTITLALSPNTPQHAARRARARAPSRRARRSPRRAADQRDHGLGQAGEPAHQVERPLR